MGRVTLGQNISALVAQGALNRVTDQLAQNYTKLASGLRINRAADDAAGLSIAVQLDANSRVFAQGVRNVNDGISAINIADGALGALSDIRIRLAELAAQAANGTYGVKQRLSVAKESDALVDEYNRTLSAVSFNGLHLFDGSILQFDVQAGQGREAAISVGLAPQNSTSYIGLGTFNALATQTVAGGGGHPRGSAVADLNNDGIADLIIADDTHNAAAVMLGNGDGTFKAGVDYAARSRVYAVTIADFNGDGNLDIAASEHSAGNGISVFLNNGNGTFQARRTLNATGATSDAIQAGDLNGDGIADLVVSSQYTTGLSVFIGNGNGTFQALKTYQGGTGVGSIEFADFNNDGRVDIVTSEGAGNSAAILYGNGNGTFGSAQLVGFGGGVHRLTVGDYNRDGQMDIAALIPDNGVQVRLGNGNGTFGSATMYAVPSARVWALVQGDFNSDGYSDLAMRTMDIDPGYYPYYYTSYTNSGAGVLFGNGNGSFKAAQTVTGFGLNATGPGDASFLSAGDFNGDGVDDLATVDSTGLGIALSQSVHSLRMPKLNLQTRSGALAAMGVLDRAQQALLDMRSRLGSAESRLHVTLNTLTVGRENFLAAKSRITDVDTASESANLARNQILREAAAAVLAQANQQPEIAIKLLSSA